MNKCLLTSKTDMWETPQELFDQLNEKWHFDIDLCAVSENAKCSKYYDPETDSLLQKWEGICWMNPPYGREIKKWIKKAYEAAKNGEATVVCLVPSRTDTIWWHSYCLKAEIEFIKGRLKFGDSKNPAPFPSAIVVFEKNKVR